MFFRSKPAFEIVAPVTGTAIPLDKVPDPIFAEKTVGDGIAIIPSGSEVVAPFDCEVIQIAHTGHALAVCGSNGLEFLIHLGIDTVQLKKNIFHYCVQTGDKVKKGERMVSVDWDTIRESSYSSISPCLLLDYQKLKRTRFYYGALEAGKTKIMDVYF